MFPCILCLNSSLIYPLVEILEFIGSANLISIKLIVPLHTINEYFSTKMKEILLELLLQEVKNEVYSKDNCTTLTNHVARADTTSGANLIDFRNRKRMIKVNIQQSPRNLAVAAVKVMKTFCCSYVSSALGTAS